MSEAFNEKDHPRGQPDNAGQFVSKNGGSVSPKVKEFKETLKKLVEPKKEIREIQKEVAEDVTNSVNQVIKHMGLNDVVKEVAMQGSYEKGTDLPTSGSDLDLFVVFDKSVPEDERKELGLQIGMRALAGKNPRPKTATSKYAEAFFTHKGQEMEVQVVPTVDYTLDEIKNKMTAEGQPIKDIGMARTPHQTKFMKEALKGKEHEVRILKQFMKDTGLYDSSMKSQGFSGYSAEVLIHNFDTFENTLEFFADFKSGTVIGGDKGHEGNIFSLIDPIDPNRDLISAFSPMKIGRTIKTAKHFLEHGEPPKRSPPVELPSVTVNYKTTQEDQDTLTGQTRRTQNSITQRLKGMGFDIPTNTEKITSDFSVDIHRTDMNNIGDNVKLIFGTNNLTIPETYKDRGVPITLQKAVDEYKKANNGLQFITEDGRIKAIKKRQFTNMKDALDYILKNPVGNIQKTSVVDDIGSGFTLEDGKSKFENLI